MSEPARADWTMTEPSLVVRSETLPVQTMRAVQIIDLTPALSALVRASGLEAGLANVQVLHTTMGLLLNEWELLLHEDLERTLEALAPAGSAYRHDDMARRVPVPPPGERRNGHAHCRAMVLRGSETLNVRGGALVLGRWQRVLLAELDGPQARLVSVALLGSAQAGAGSGGTTPW